ncbi:MAG: hypothetical protein NZ845_00335 [Thermodesulfovibrio sp.]|nr:hypothetical protein [Thermodesulfovibrio sp.]MCX7725117.1 hypothetical protein [Thermodesulfovibrio sp.]MDW7972714.1 hypothetical protein [Thermodesulfovibrio sp.]
MYETPKISVDLAALIAYLPEIVTCLNSPSEDLQNCQICQFKQECMIVSAVGFMVTKFINGEKINLGSEKMN